MSDAQKAKSPKYKWTKELVNKALHEGMTQEEIARVCRTQQSVVSSWKNGKNKATEQQLAELIRRYGAQLNRTTARIYLVSEPQPGPWEESEIGRRLLALRERRKSLILEIQDRQKQARQTEAQPASRKEVTLRTMRKPKRLATAVPPQPMWPAGLTDGMSVSQDVGRTYQEEQALEEEVHQALEPQLAILRRQVDPYSQRTWALDKLIEHYAASFAERGIQRLVRVEGSILFRYTFMRPIKRAQNRRWELAREPLARWLVHDLHGGKLVLVTQSRRQLTAFQRDRWEQEVAQLDSSLVAARTEPVWLDSADDAGRWISSVRGPLSVDELLKHVDSYLRDPSAVHRPHDELVLPYLLRKTLAEHGHAVQGIDRITASE